MLTLYWCGDTVYKALTDTTEGQCRLQQGRGLAIDRDNTVGGNCLLATTGYVSFLHYLRASPISHGIVVPGGRMSQEDTVGLSRQPLFFFFWSFRAT